MKMGVDLNRFFAFAKKYKLLHVFFWTLVIIQHSFVYFDNEVPLLSTLIENSSLVIIGFVPFYFTAYFVVPNYLYKGRFVWYFILIIAQACQMTLTYLVIFYVYNYIYYPDYFYDSFSDGAALHFLQHFFIIFWTYVIPLVCASAVKVMSDRFRSESRLDVIRREKLSTELNFLRNQIHPHFLFNVMNTIYFLISRNNKKARSLVELTSDMLRYQLYECNTDLTSMDKEIEYLQNYLKITEYKSDINHNITLDLDDRVRKHRIAPLLIAPILENAIKHNTRTDKRLNIKLAEGSEGKVIIEIKNEEELRPNDVESFTDHDEELDNLKRRLEILYPSRHFFEYYRDKEQFYSKLTLTNGTY